MKRLAVSLIACLALSILLPLWPCSAVDILTIESLPNDEALYTSGYDGLYATLWNSSTALYNLSHAFLVGQSGYADLAIMRSVDADGDYTQWQSTYLQHYTAVLTDDGDTGYVYTTTMNRRDSWHFQNPTSNREINLTRIYVKARLTSGIGSFQIFVRINGSNYDSPTTYTLSTSYQLFEWKLPKSPATNTFWTTTELANMQIGILSVSGRAELRATYAYVYINYQKLALYRSAIFFNTTNIATDYQHGYLSVFVDQMPVNPNWNLTIQNGDAYGKPSFPTVQKDDFWQGYYSGNGGNRSLTEATLDTYFNITLTTLTWLNYSGITRFMLRSDEDINAVYPTSLKSMTIQFSQYLVLTRAVSNVPILFIGGVFCGSIIVLAILLVRRKRHS